MYTNFKIVKVDYKYCDYLRQFDNRVPYNAGTKELRPFIGILFMVGNCEYFAPLSSPKQKHKTLKNTLDLFKIDKGNYGVINFNNMIPVTSNNYTEFDLNKKTRNKSEMFRLELLKNQLRFLTANKKEVLNKSKLLYNLHKNNKLPKNVYDRCCDFILLEGKCRDYNNK
jgi:protein AbiQ